MLTGLAIDRDNAPSLHRIKPLVQGLYIVDAVFSEISEHYLTTI